MKRYTKKKVKLKQCYRLKCLLFERPCLVLTPRVFFSPQRFPNKKSEVSHSLRQTKTDRLSVQYVIDFFRYHYNWWEREKKPLIRLVKKRRKQSVAVSMFINFHFQVLLYRFEIIQASSLCLLPSSLTTTPFFTIKFLFMLPNLLQFYFIYFLFFYFCKERIWKKINLSKILGPHNKSQLLSQFSIW